MDISLYKDVVTFRGFTYHYYYSPAQGGKPTLLLCHGFPSNSQDWRRMVPYFIAKGYGVIAPDMLGYGGTDKPTDPAKYVGSGLTRDLIDILDDVNINKVVAVGHDWGCEVVSRLASWFPERVIAYAFVAVTYMAPWPENFDYEAYNEESKQEIGYELFGYWAFFNRDDAAEIIQKHIESFHSILFPKDPKTWIDRMAITGGLEKSLLEDFKTPVPSYLTEHDRRAFIETFRADGLGAPTCWYKNILRGFAPADDAQIPPERAYPPPNAPVFWAATKEDYICRPAWGLAQLKQGKFNEGQVTIKEYDADHWLMLSHGVELSKDLDNWIASFAE